jgi:hypothetical protein
MALPAIVGALLRGVLKEIAKTGGKQALLKSAVKAMPKTLQQEAVKYLVRNSPVGMAKRIANTFKFGVSVVTHPIKTARKLTIGRVEGVIKKIKSKSPYAISKTLKPSNRILKVKQIKKQLMITNAQLKLAPLSKRQLIKKVQLEKALKRATKLASQERRYERMLVKSAKQAESYKQRIKGLKGKKLAEEIKLIESEARARAREIHRQRKNQHKLH